MHKPAQAGSKNNECKLLRCVLIVLILCGYFCGGQEEKTEGKKKVMMSDKNFGNPGLLQGHNDYQKVYTLIEVMFGVIIRVH